MDPIYAPHASMQGPVVMQKLSERLWLVGENHRIQENACPQFPSWLNAWIQFARKHPSQHIHFLTEVSFYDIPTRTSTIPPVRPIDQVCVLWNSGKQPSNMHMHEADGRYLAPFFPLEMMYHEAFYQHMRTNYALFHRNEKSSIERMNEFSRMFQVFENRMLDAISTTAKARRFLKKLLLHTPPKWYTHFVEACRHPLAGNLTQNPSPQPFLQEDPALRRRFLHWLDHHLDNVVVSNKGKYTPFMQGLQEMSPWMAERAPKIARDHTTVQYFTMVFSVCLEVHMLVAWWTLQKKHPHHIVVMVSGFQHTRNLLRFFAEDTNMDDSAHVFTPTGCIELERDLTKGALKP